MRSDRAGGSSPKESCAEQTQSVSDSSPDRAPIIGLIDISYTLREKETNTMSF